jgi:hydroxypyruvate reductase
VRQQLRELFVATVGDLDVRAAMRNSWLVPTDDRTLLIAFGKAARPMASTAVELLGSDRVRGLVVPPEPDAAPLPPLEVIPGGHPLPTAGSLRAAARALELCRSVAADEDVLFLVSGGGSSMLELPADPRVTLDELRRFYAALVGSGAGIFQINTVRKHMSAVKGGKLAIAARAARFQNTMEICDVPAGAAVASGPSYPDGSTLAHCQAILTHYRLLDAVPPALRERLARGDLPPNLSLKNELGLRVQITSVLNNGNAQEHARQRLLRAGIECAIDGWDDTWHDATDYISHFDSSLDELPIAATADRLFAQLRAARAQHPGRPVAVIAGGELSVPLPPQHGIGGRNQQFALACALAIEGQPIAVLSAGTDGIDGNSPAAGAVVDGTTVARARALGLDPVAALANFDAYPLFAALGDAVVTGPTGTNVRDLRLLVAM